jgi:GLPGLI family protein
MKKNILNILLLFFFYTNGQIKNLTVVYGCSYNVKAEDRMNDAKKLKEEHFDLYNEIIKSDSLANHIELILILNSNKTKMFGIETKNQELNDVFNEFIGNDTIYTDLKTKDIFIYKHDYWGQNLLLDYNYQKYNWIVSSEHKLINNRICNKATLTYKTEDKKNTYEFKVTAWFDPQINTNIGPIGYGGLPGLIVELDDGYRTYYVKEIKFKSEKFKIQDSFKKTVHLSLEDFRTTFDEIKREFKSSFK